MKIKDQKIIHSIHKGEIQDILRNYFPNCEVYVNEFENDTDEIKFNLDLYIKTK
mgnify:CR=1 FL=1